MNSQKLEDPAKLGQASFLQLLKRSPLLGKYSRHSLSRGTTHNNRPRVSNTSASWMGMPNHIHLTALFGVHLRMLPTCKQQSQFCCQYNFYLEQAEVLFQEFPRLLRHVVCWHCTTQPKEERQKNQSCCSAHPERDYLEQLICFQEETGSAQQTSPPQKKYKKIVFNAGECYTWHVSIFITILETLFQKQSKKEKCSISERQESDLFYSSLPSVSFAEYRSVSPLATLPFWSLIRIMCTMTAFTAPAKVRVPLCKRLNMMSIYKINTQDKPRTLYSPYFKHAENLSCLTSFMTIAWKI